jgi:hypothetical protein
MRIFLIAASFAALTGCATLTRGTTDQIQILSDPPDAVVTTSLGHSCRTPCTLTVSRKDEFTVAIEKEGYGRAQVPVITEIAGAGGAAFAGNILLGGVVGMGADAATGAAYSHTPNPVSVTLEAIPQKEDVPAVVRHFRKRRAPQS